MPDDDDVDDGPALKLLAGAYFHEDYREVSTDEVGAVRDFAVEEGPGDVRRLRVEIHDLLERAVTEDDLTEVWTRAYRAKFNPTRSGMTYREWFERILQILAEYPGGS